MAYLTSKSNYFQFSYRDRMFYWMEYYQGLDDFLSSEKEVERISLNQVLDIRAEMRRVEILISIYRNELRFKSGMNIKFFEA